MLDVKDAHNLTARLSRSFETLNILKEANCFDTFSKDMRWPGRREEQLPLSLLVFPSQVFFTVLRQV